MSTRFYVSVLLCLAICTFSCHDNKDPNTFFYKSLNETLERSGSATYLSTQVITAALESKFYDYTTRPKAEIWYPKVQRITSSAKKVVSYIENIKRAIAKNSKTYTVKGVVQEYDLDIVNKVIREQGNGVELYKRLWNLQDSLVIVDPLIFASFRIRLLPKPFDTAWLPDQFIDSFFSNQPAIAVLCVLNQFKNNIWTEENRLVTFCHEQIRPTIIDCNFEAPLVSQSSTILKAGEDLKIEAGIGSFETRGDPVVKIGNQFIPLKYGIATRKIKVPVKAGNYKIPVRIKFTDQDGKTVEMEKMVEYTVRDE